jgi:AraC-like DNA-binding protein
MLLARSDDPCPRCASPVERRHAGVARVRAHLQAHLEESVSLAELAAVAGLSRCYLLRAFAREHGVTPHAYQMLLRVARAWHLIGEGVSISRVAYDAGFADQSHLTRRFAEVHGVSPGRWARLLAIPPGSAPEGVPALRRISSPSPAA